MQDFRYANTLNGPVAASARVLPSMQPMPASQPERLRRSVNWYAIAAADLTCGFFTTDAKVHVRRPEEDSS